MPILVKELQRRKYKVQHSILSTDYVIKVSLVH